MGVVWVILTNGSVWQVYHITGGLPVVIDLALEVNLLGDEPPAHKVGQLFYLLRRKLNAGLTGGRLPRSGTVQISSYFRTL